MPKKIRVRIKENLIKHHMTQSELAKRINIREATISDYANGKRSSVRLDIILRIMAEFGIDDLNEILEVTYVDEKERKES